MDAGKNLKHYLKEIPTAKIDVMELDLRSAASARKLSSDYNSSHLTYHNEHIIFLGLLECLSIYF